MDGDEDEKEPDTGDELLPLEELEEVLPYAFVFESFKFEPSRYSVG